MQTCTFLTGQVGGYNYIIMLGAFWSYFHPLPTHINTYILLTTVMYACPHAKGTEDSRRHLVWYNCTLQSVLVNIWHTLWLEQHNLECFRTPSPCSLSLPSPDPLPARLAPSHQATARPRAARCPSTRWSSLTSVSTSPKGQGSP